MTEECDERVSFGSEVDRRQRGERSRPCSLVGRMPYFLPVNGNAQQWDARVRLRGELRGVPSVRRFAGVAVRLLNLLEWHHPHDSGGRAGADQAAIIKK